MQTPLTNGNKKCIKLGSFERRANSSANSVPYASNCLEFFSDMNLSSFDLVEGSDNPNNANPASKSDCFVAAKPSNSASRLSFLTVAGFSSFLCNAFSNPSSTTFVLSI